MTDTSNDLDTAYKEWTEARSIIMWYEDKLHDLRKYGFSIVAALVSTTAITAMLNMDPSASLILVLLTCVLLMAIFLFDRNYRFYQKAASGRVKILEPILNIKLSETLAIWYYSQQMFTIVPILYIVLLWVTCFLGFFVAVRYWLIIATTGIIISLGIAIVDRYVDRNLEERVGKAYKKIPMDKKKDPNDKSGENYIGDWSIDKISCECGDLIKFTLTNSGGSYLSDKDGNRTRKWDTISFNKDDVILYLSDEKNDHIYLKALSDIKIPRNFNYSWLWIPETIHENKIFTIHPSLSRRLKHTIFVRKAKDSLKPEPQK